MRARNIKPGFFENEDISDLPFQTRLLFIGLWLYADRDGKFEWRPKKIKACIFPYDNCKIEEMLMSLHAAKLIDMYRYGNDTFGIIPKFLKHQSPHPHEAKSRIPDPPEKNQQNQCHDMSITLPEMTVKCHSDIRMLGCYDSLNPDVINHDSLNDDSTPIAPSRKNDSKPKMEFDYETGSFSNITPIMIDLWQTGFPAVNIEQELKRAGAWAMANPKNRKSNWPKFLTNWFSRAQDKAGRVENSREPPKYSPAAAGTMARIEELRRKKAAGEI